VCSLYGTQSLQCEVWCCVSSSMCMCLTPMSIIRKESSLIPPLWDRKTLPMFPLIASVFIRARVEDWSIQLKRWQDFSILELVSENSLFRWCPPPLPQYIQWSPLKGHSWNKDTPLIRTLAKSQLHINMYFLPSEMRTPL